MPKLGNSQKLLVGSNDLTSVLYELNMQLGCETPDDTDWDDTHAVVQAGIETGAMSGSLRYTTGATGTDTVMSGLLGTKLGPVTLIMGTTEGDTTFTIDSLHNEYGVADGAAGDRHAVSWAIVPSGDLFIGRLQVAPGDKTSSSNATGIQLGTLDTGERLYSALHVISGSGGNLTVTVESDDNSGFTSATTRITHTVATGATSELKNLAGAVATDDYWRSEWTISAGTFSFVHAFGIKEAA